MPLQIVRNDITHMKVDAIVNAANESLLGGGGVDGCIHRGAGPELLEECRSLGGCKTGDAKVTGAYRLPAKYVIHTVGPIWQGGAYGEEALLRSCYCRCLALAKERGCESIAFPLISAGAYGYPRQKALQTAMDVITAFLLEQEMTVYLVVFDERSYLLSSHLMAEIKSYIDRNYVETHTERERSRIRSARQLYSDDPDLRRRKAYVETSLPPMAKESVPMPRAAASLEDALNTIDESFSEMLLRKIDEGQMKDSTCYKKANIDRKLFSKIRSDRHYRPSKPTVLAFAIALELPLWETKEMLMKAGYALSHSNKFDIIVEYFIQKGNYNIYEINEALFAFDQSLLGG